MERIKIPVLKVVSTKHLSHFLPNSSSPGRTGAILNFFEPAFFVLQFSSAHADSEIPPALSHVFSFFLFSAIMPAVRNYRIFITFYTIEAPPSWPISCILKDKNLIFYFNSFFKAKQSLKPNSLHSMMPNCETESWVRLHRFKVNCIFYVS